MSTLFTVALDAVSANAPHVSVLAAVPNPLDGITPDMSVLGGAFRNTWVKVASAIYGIMVAVSAVYLMGAFVGLSQAKKAHNPHQMSEALGDVKLRAGAFGGLLATPVIIGAIILVVS